MNEKQPEWYKDLQKGPYAGEPFSQGKKENVIQLADKISRGERVSSRRRGRSLIWSWAAAAAVVLVVVLFVYRNEGLLLTEGGKGAAVTPSPAPTVDPPNVTSPPAIEKEEVLVNPPKLTGYLKDGLPFSIEEVQKIWVKETMIPADRMYVILQNLNWLELTKAASESKAVNDTAILRFETADVIYEIPYDVSTNEFHLGEKRFYADDQVMLLMHGLLQPDSKLAELDRMLEQARLEMESHEGGIDESFSYEGERLAVADKSYNEWEQLLFVRSSAQPTLLGHYYDDAIQQTGDITEYSDGIMKLNRSIVFMDSNYATPDGLTVSMTKQQVLEKLGKPNLELESKWSYKIGDYLKFHLYFDHNKIKYIVLSQPL